MNRGGGFLSATPVRETAQLHGKRSKKKKNVPACERRKFFPGCRHVLLLAPPQLEDPAEKGM